MEKHVWQTIKRNTPFLRWDFNSLFPGLNQEAVLQKYADDKTCRQWLIENVKRIEECVQDFSVFSSVEVWISQTDEVLNFGCDTTLSQAFYDFLAGSSKPYLIDFKLDIRCIHPQEMETVPDLIEQGAVLGLRLNPGEPGWFDLPRLNLEIYTELYEDEPFLSAEEVNPLAHVNKPQLKKFIETLQRELPVEISDAPQYFTFG